MLKKYIFILVVIILLIIGITMILKNDPNTSYKKISIEEMNNIIDNGIVIDVRTNEEHNEYNLDNSVNIPLDTLEDNITDYSKDTQIFIYCKSGVRSKEAVLKLLELGYTNVYDLGGIINTN